MRVSPRVLARRALLRLARAPSQTHALVSRLLLARGQARSEEHTSELQSQSNLVCRLLLEKKNKLVANSSGPMKRKHYCGLTPAGRLNLMHAAHARSDTSAYILTVTIASDLNSLCTHDQPH